MSPSVWLEQLRRLAVCVDRHDVELRHVAVETGGGDRCSLRALAMQDSDAAGHTLLQLKAALDQQWSTVASEHRALLADSADDGGDTCRLTQLITSADQCLARVRRQTTAVEKCLSVRGYRSYAQTMADAAAAATDTAAADADATAAADADATADDAAAGGGGHGNTDDRERPVAENETNEAGVGTVSAAATTVASDSNDDGSGGGGSGDSSGGGSHWAADGSPELYQLMRGASGPALVSPHALPSLSVTDTDGNLLVQVTPGAARPSSRSSRSSSSLQSSSGQAAWSASSSSSSSAAAAAARGVAAAMAGVDDVTPPPPPVSDYGRQLLAQLEQRCRSVRKTRTTTTTTTAATIGGKIGGATAPDDTPPMPELSEYSRRLLHK